MSNLVNELKDSTCKAYERRIKKLRCIKFNIEDARINDIVDLFYGMFVDKLATYYVDNGELHCGNSRYRTVRDTYLLALYYFPDISYGELYDAFKYLVDEPEVIFGGYYVYCDVAGGKTLRIGQYVCKEGLRLLRKNKKLNYTNPK